MVPGRDGDEDGIWTGIWGGCDGVRHSLGSGIVVCAGSCQMMCSIEQVGGEGAGNIHDGFGARRTWVMTSHLGQDGLRQAWHRCLTWLARLRLWSLPPGGYVLGSTVALIITPLIFNRRPRHAGRDFMTPRTRAVSQANIMRSIAANNNNLNAAAQPTLGKCERVNLPCPQKKKRHQRLAFADS